MKPKFSNPFEAAKQNSKASDQGQPTDFAQFFSQSSRTSLDYLTPQNQPTLYEIPAANQLKNDSMFNKTRSKLPNIHTVVRHSSSCSSASGGRFHRQYNELELLHQGRFSKTFRVLDKVQSAEYIIKTDCDQPSDQRNSSLTREGHVLSALLRSGSACQYITRYYQMWREDSNLYVVLECCNQTLCSLKDSQPINEQLVLRFMLHISRALQYLHSNEMIHFNVEIGNILVSDSIFKLTDFKLTQKIRNQGDMNKIPKIEQYTIDETRFLPLEMMQREFEGNTLDRIDIYGLGMVVFHVMTNLELPTWRDMKWKEMRIDNFVETTLNGMESYSSRIRELVTNLVSMKAKERPNANEIVGLLAAVEDPILQEKDRRIEQLEKQLKQLQDMKKALHFQSPMPMRSAARMGTGARLSAKRPGK